PLDPDGVERDVHVAPHQRHEQHREDVARPDADLAVGVGKDAHLDDEHQDPEQQEEQQEEQRRGGRVDHGSSSLRDRSNVRRISPRVKSEGGGGPRRDARAAGGTARRRPVARGRPAAGAGTAGQGSVFWTTCSTTASLAVVVSLNTRFTETMWEPGGRTPPISGQEKAKPPPPRTATGRALAQLRKAALTSLPSRVSEPPAMSGRPITSTRSKRWVVAMRPVDGRIATPGRLSFAVRSW